MDCRIAAIATPLSTALLWLGVAVSTRGAEPQIAPLDVSGDDFPVLVQAVAGTVRFDALNLPDPGCSDIRARRVDELPLPWRKVVERVHLDCDRVGQDSAGKEMVALVGTAFLKPGAVRMAGHPVAEVRLMDSELWGDHQYVLDTDYAAAAASLRALIEARCQQQQRIREQAAGHQDCRMKRGSAGLYLSSDEISGIWVHADPDDPQRTIYAEAWAD
jgi:hypothetical protein